LVGREITSFGKNSLRKADVSGHDFSRAAECKNRNPALARASKALTCKRKAIAKKSGGGALERQVNRYIL
jgi:hypothetical protein